MPSDFFINAQLGMVFSKAVGVFGRSDAWEHSVRLRGHPEFRPEYNQLTDLREITELTLSNQDVREFATQTVFSANSKRAFVVSSDIQFGIVRMFATHRELVAGEHGVVVFRKMTEALKWLGLPDEPDPALFRRLASPTARV